MLEIFSTKCTRDNLDKSTEFIFDGSEEKLKKNWRKILWSEDYSKVKIISLQPRHHLLQKDSMWSIGKML